MRNFFTVSHGRSFHERSYEAASRGAFFIFSTGKIHPHLHIHCTKASSKRLLLYVYQLDTSLHGTSNHSLILTSLVSCNCTARPNPKTCSTLPAHSKTTTTIVNHLISRITYPLTTYPPDPAPCLSATETPNTTWLLLPPHFLRFFFFTCARPPGSMGA